MPDIFVNAASGVDSTTRGNTAARPLRTITYAIDQGIIRYSERATVNIRIADGTYNQAGGETLPLILSPSFALIGAGIGRTIIELDRSFGDSDICINGGRELASFTLQGDPKEPGACRIAIGIYIVGAPAYLHDIHVTLNPAAASDEDAFSIGVWFYGDALTAENIIGDHCSSSCIAGRNGTASIRSCEFTNSFSGITIEGDISGNISYCNFRSGLAWGMKVIVPSTVQIHDNIFDGPGWGMEVVWRGVRRRSESPLIRTEVPMIRNNIFGGSAIKVTADCIVESNEFILQHTGAISAWIGLASRSDYPWALMSPVFRNNTFRRLDTTFPWEPMVKITGQSTPVFEENNFTADDWRSWGVIAEIKHDALPDFGGGASSSRGGNRFEAGWIRFRGDSESVAREFFFAEQFLGACTTNTGKRPLLHRKLLY